MDPSWSSFGIVLLKLDKGISYSDLETKVISLPKHASDGRELQYGERLSILIRELYDFFGLRKLNIEKVYIEGFAFGKSYRREMCGMIIGATFAFFLMLYGSDFMQSRVELLPPPTVKKLFTGSGRASKEDVVLTAHRVYGVNLEWKGKQVQDLYDAFATLVAGLKKDKPEIFV